MAWPWKSEIYGAASEGGGMRRFKVNCGTSNSVLLGYRVRYSVGGARRGSAASGCRRAARQAPQQAGPWACTRARASCRPSQERLRLDLAVPELPPLSGVSAQGSTAAGMSTRGHAGMHRCAGRVQGRAAQECGGGGQRRGWPAGQYPRRPACAPDSFVWPPPPPALVEILICCGPAGGGSAAGGST